MKDDKTIQVAFHNVDVKMRSLQNLAIINIKKIKIAVNNLLIDYKTLPELQNLNTEY